VTGTPAMGRRIAGVPLSVLIARYAEHALATAQRVGRSLCSALLSGWGRLPLQGFGNARQPYRGGYRFPARRLGSPARRPAKQRFDNARRHR
jgi:hypothetical protein